MRNRQKKRIAKLYRKAYFKAIFTDKARFIFDLMMIAEGWNRPADVPF